jgi:transposase
VQNATLWRALLGVEKAVIEGIEFDEDEQLLVAHVRPRKTGARPVWSVRATVTGL